MVYAKISNGVVVNTQVLSDNDYKDPQFQWVQIDGLYCDDGSCIEIGCEYDGSNFSQGAV